jgi:hypothetical protein
VFVFHSILSSSYHEIPRSRILLTAAALNDGSKQVPGNPAAGNPGPAPQKKPVDKAKKKPEYA